jgi:hypothetical protein
VERGANVATKKRKLIRAESIYIDPMNCNSTVGYAIINGQRGVYADIDITDCNRRVTWHFSKYDGNQLAKIDAAIGILIRFRSELDTAIRRRRRGKRRA